MDKAELSITTKGKRAITFNNFLYREQRTSQLLGRVTWRCPFKSCNGRLWTDQQLGYAIERGEHNHLAD